MTRYKKIFFILIFLGLVPFSCRKVKYPYYQVDDIQIQAFKDSKLNNMVLQTDSLTSDTTYLQLKFVGKNIAFNQLNFDFTNSAYALTKPFDGHKGLKDKVSNILFYSNRLFNGRLPETSLNDFFIWGHSLEDWKSTMNTSSCRYFEFNPNLPDIILLTKRPQDSLRHILTLELIFDSGVKKTASTTITWK